MRWKKDGENYRNILHYSSLPATDDITTEELTMFPGMEDLISLLRVLDYYKQNTYDVIIIDCAPTGETLAMLSFRTCSAGGWKNYFLLKEKF